MIFLFFVVVLKTVNVISLLLHSCFMVSLLIDDVLSRAEKFDRIYEILGIPRERYDELFHKYGEEFRGIVKIGSFVKAGIELLRWLGFRDEEIDLEKVVKSVVVMKVLVHHINKSSGQAKTLLIKKGR